MKKSIALYGPPVNKSISGAYGGGTGGYTRNMATYLNFKFENIKLIPLYHTVRGEVSGGKLSFFFRFFIDAWRIIKFFKSRKPDSVHILAQYRSATIREFFLAFFCKITNTPFLYEIKAGAFIKFYEDSNFISRYFVRFIIINANRVLCEGSKNIPFIKEHFNKESFYNPNVVLTEEIPMYGNKLFTTDVIKVVFVGYCVRGKGVFELVEGINSFCTSTNQKVDLTLIGSEHFEFSSFIDSFQCSKNFNINRMGKLPHDSVMEKLQYQDIYCYPTDHEGEGHNNSINEAMMYGLTIITTKKGFLEDVLNDDSAYFMENVSSNEVKNALSLIISNLTLAKGKAELARIKLINNYNSDVIYSDLVKHYDSLIEK